MFHFLLLYITQCLVLYLSLYIVTCNNDADIQTWSSRDLSLGLETSRDLFLQVLVSVLVLEPQSLGLGLGLGTSGSWSWSWNPRVSVLVLGLATTKTMKTRSSSLMKREIVRLPPLLPWNRYLATVVCWCGQTGLEWVTQLVYLRCNN